MDIILTYITNKMDYSGENIGLYYLAAALEQSGYEARVFCGDSERLLCHIGNLEPKVVGFCCDYNNRQLVTRISKKIKEEYQDIVMLAGGPQAPALGGDFLRLSGCSYILRGEGEYTLPRLMDSLLRGAGKREDIPGLCYMENDIYRENSPAGQITDLDALPLPAYHLSLDPDESIGSAVLTGRGCPFSCTYCAKPLGPGVRFRSIGSVLEEIRRNLADNREIKYIKISDDTFTLSRERILEFCSGMRDIREKNKIVWYCECHAGVMSDWCDLLPEMVESGLVRLQIGIESGDRQVLDLYGKHTTPESLENFVASAYTAGVPQIAGNIIIGGPREAEGATLELIRRLLYAAPGVIDLTTGFLRAYPGTEISRQPEKFGLAILAGESDVIADDYPSVVPIGMSADDVVRLRHACNRQIRAVMKEIINDRILPDAAAVRQYEMQEFYGINSRWSMEIRSHYFAGTYYKMMSVGDGGPLPVNPDMDMCYPVRTFDLWRTILYDRGYPEINRAPLSPFEHELISCCSGKLSLAAIEDIIREKYGRAYQDMNDFHQWFMTALRNFNNKYWVSFYSINL